MKTIKSIRESRIHFIVDSVRDYLHWLCGSIVAYPSCQFIHDSLTERCNRVVNSYHWDLTSPYSHIQLTEFHRLVSLAYKITLPIVSLPEGIEDNLKYSIKDLERICNSLPQIDSCFFIDDLPF